MARDWAASIRSAIAETALARSEPLAGFGYGAGLVAATRERPVELRHYFSILRRRLVLIAVTVAVAASVA